MEGGGWTEGDHRAGTSCPTPLCHAYPEQDMCFLGASWPRSAPPWVGACMLTLQPSPPPLPVGGDGIHHHPVQLHVQQQLCGGHEPAAHPHYHHPGGPGVSLWARGGKGVRTGGWAWRQGGPGRGEGKPEEGGDLPPLQVLLRLELTLGGQLAPSPNPAAHQDQSCGAQGGQGWRGPQRSWFWLCLPTPPQWAGAGPQVL